MKALLVIRREYKENVRKRSFIISTIVVPIFMLAFLVIPIVLSGLEPNDRYRVTVLDQTGAMGRDIVLALNDTLQDGSRKYVANAIAARGDRFDAHRLELVEKIIQGKLDIVVAIPSTVLDDGKLSYITREVRSFTVLERFESVVADIVLERRLASAGLEYEQVRSLTTGVFMELSQITSKGEVEPRDFLSEWGLVFVFVMILYMALLTWGITISRGIIEEKSSRVVEVLLSSIKPFDLLFGKVVGTGLAGLTQLSIWAVAGFFISLYGATGAAPVLENIHVAPIIFVYFMLYFVLGFLLYSAMFTVIGSICSTDQDAQQLQGLVTLPLIIPILCLMLIIQSPNSTFAVVLSLIPVFTPMVMLARVILLEPPLWQILLSIALLTASIFAAVSFSARVFRIGILMYGKRPSLREVIRWYRLSG